MTQIHTKAREIAEEIWASWYHSKLDSMSLVGLYARAIQDEHDKIFAMTNVVLAAKDFCYTEDPEDTDGNYEVLVKALELLKKIEQTK